MIVDLIIVVVWLRFDGELESPRTGASRRIYRDGLRRRRACIDSIIKNQLFFDGSEWRFASRPDWGSQFWERVGRQS